MNEHVCCGCHDKELLRAGMIAAAKLVCWRCGKGAPILDNSFWMHFPEQEEEKGCRAYMIWAELEKEKG